MNETMIDLINLGVFVFLVLLGLIAGTIAEKRHFASIRKREKEFLNMPAVTIRSAVDYGDVETANLAIGSCVISLDYFKRMLASLRNIFGGRVRAYETLVDRGRREAILRMKRAAKKADADLILNLRIETSSIGQSANRKNGLGSIEVFAYGTAVKLKK